MTLFVLSLCPFDISVGVGAFVIGLSQISSFFSLQGFLKMYSVLDMRKSKRNEFDTCIVTSVLILFIRHESERVFNTILTILIR